MWTQSIKAFLRNQGGTTTVEYAVMAAQVVLVCLAAMLVLEQAVEATFNALAAAVYGI